jgi:hypothetical protein
MNVTVVGMRGKTALVEYVDSGGCPQRVYIPRDKLAGDQCDKSVLDMGVRYGIDWERAITLKTTTRDLARALRARGFWTLRDMEARPNEVLGALQSAYGVDLSALLRAARKQEVR